MLCRLCLTDLVGDGASLSTGNDTNREVSGGAVDPSTFLAFIAKCLHLELTPSDVICTECWQHLHEFDKFCKYIEVQQNIWYSANTIVKSEVEYIKEELDTYSCPTVAETTIDPISITEEEFVFTTNNDVAVETEIELQRLTDNMPAEDTRQDTEMLEKKTPSKKIRYGRNRKKSEKKKYKLRVETPEMLQKLNEFIKSNNLFFCELCEESFESLELLRMHFREKHNCIGYIKCCDLVIKTYTRLIDHVKYHLDPKCYGCEICNLFYKSEGHLNSHKLHKHSKDFKHNCTLCNRGFATTSTFEKHMLRHAPEKQYPCKICNKRLLNKYNLAVHMKAVHEDVSLICDHCGKKYKSPISFQQHIDKHKNGTIKDHEQCQRGDRLKTDPNNTECKLCDRKYCSRASYIAHVRQWHNCPTKNIFTCEHCHKVFTYKQKFEEHLTVHTGEKRYSCPYCDNKLRFKANLGTHIKTYHPNEQIKLKKKKLPQMRAESETA